MATEGMNLKQDERAALALRRLFESYGYDKYKMNKFEEYDLYVRNKSFLVSDHIITFTDQGGRLMALKPDVTLSIVKNTKEQPVGVQKVYYNENVYRISPGASDFREIMQVGLECIGQVDRYAVCEVLSLAAQSLGQLSPDFVLEISHLDVIARELDVVGVDAQTRARLLACLAEKNTHDIELICRQAQVEERLVTRLKQLVGTYGTPEQVLPALARMAEGDERLQAAVAELSDVIAAVGSTNVRIDFSLVSDMNYYNGIVFRGYIKGVPTRILSGGCYDGLMNKMGKCARAIGFALYLDLLESLRDTPAAYDADTVVLYDEATAPRVLLAKVSAAAARGERVLAQREVADGLRYRTLIDMRGKGD